MTKLHVGLDLDGVVVNFADWANAWLAETHNTDPLAIEKWDWWQDYDSQLRPESAWRRMWEHIGVEQSFYDMEPMPDALGGIRELKDMGVKVTYVTARNPRYAHETQWWLDHHGVLAGSYVVHTANKWLVPVDLFLDDQPLNVKALIESGINARLFARSWNGFGEDEASADLPCVASWGEFLELARQQARVYC